MKWSTNREAAQFIDLVFNKAARIVAGDTWTFNDKRNEYCRAYAGREWFKREYERSSIHRAVYEMLERYRPDDWYALLLEWPHKAQTDANRIAYTRDERSGIADRQTLTSIGKYLRRHFSSAPDDLIRDIVAKFTYSGGIAIVNTVDEMVSAVTSGPASCMSKDFMIRCGDGVRRHPYAVYDPQYGWHMAVRRDGDEVLGRCLLLHWDEAKIYVRSYKRERDTMSHSGTDEAIESWLKSQGYVRHTEWPEGSKLARYECSDGFLMPYIDGGTQRVAETRGDWLEIDSCGDIQADNTDGRSDRNNCTCDDCGARFNDEEEGGWVGIHEEHHVCSSCLNDDYTYAYSRRGNQYYIRNDDTVEVSGEYYDINYLSDNNIVELADGDYCHEDDAVYVESEDAYYHCDDNDVCFAYDTDRYELKSDCWQCYESNNWYTDETDSVEIDGDKYHPDHAPEVEAEDDNTETN